MIEGEMNTRHIFSGQMLEDIVSKTCITQPHSFHLVIYKMPLPEQFWYKTSM